MPMIVFRMRRHTLSKAALLVCALLPAVEAHAQVDNRLALGVSVTNRLTNSSGTANNSDLGLELRIGHERPRWGWEYAFFGWFDLGVRQAGTALEGDLGNLRMRPIMAGYGYTKVRGRATVTADLVGGYSFNSFQLAPSAAADYQARTGGRNVDGHAGNAFALKPEVQIWYDLSDRFGLRVTGGYLFARPSVTISSTLGDDTRSVHADVFLVTVGVVYSIF
jgi:hypothetical protein